MKTALDTIIAQAEMVGRQIIRAVESLSDRQADYRFGEHSMSIRQALTHLADNCVAISAELAGSNYEFGSWRPSDGKFGTLVREWQELRAKALSTVRERFAGSDLSSSIEVSFATWPVWKVLSEWIVIHDAYHLGQICALRLATDPEWDMYSIYDPDE